jgi:hypothetical protein
LDSDEAQENALKSIFDFLCVHGLSYFEQKTKVMQNNESRVNKSHLNDEENKENCSQNSKHIEDEEEDENTIINNELFESDEEEEDAEESFMDLFTELLVKHLDSESDNIRLIVAKGMAKLFILGFYHKLIYNCLISH